MRFKRFLRCGALLLCGLFAFAGCGGAEDEREEEGNMPVAEYPDYDYSDYSIAAYTAPFWGGERVGNETVLFVGEEGAPLLFADAEIESVRSYDLQTEYDESDYRLEDGVLYRTETSRIPALSVAEMYPSSYVEGKTWNKKGGGYIAFSEGSYFSSMQVAVTYTHKSAWSGFVPPDCSAKAAPFLQRLAEGKSVQIAFFGDSITAGYNASGMIDYPPYAPPYADLVGGYIKARYPDSRVSWINEGVGGTNSVWGLENVMEKTAEYPIDLAVIAFGMNDSYAADAHASYARNMAEFVLSANPDACVVLVATMLPNPEAEGIAVRQETYEAALLAVAETLPNVCVAPVTSVHAALLETKRYADMTGNNVNHPNDFLMRVYAQTILRTVLGDAYTPLAAEEG